MVVSLVSLALLDSALLLDRRPRLARPRPSWAAIRRPLVARPLLTIAAAVAVAGPLGLIAWELPGAQRDVGQPFTALAFAHSPNVGATGSCRSTSSASRSRSASRTRRRTLTYGLTIHDDRLERLAKPISITLPDGRPAGLARVRGPLRPPPGRRSHAVRPHRRLPHHPDRHPPHRRLRGLSHRGPRAPAAHPESPARLRFRARLRRGGARRRGLRRPLAARAWAYHRDGRGDRPPSSAPGGADKAAGAWVSP